MRQINLFGGTPTPLPPKLTPQRWVAFTTPLLHPFQVPAGAVVKLPLAVLQELQSTPEGRGAVFDVTPKAVCHTMAELGLLTRRTTHAALYKVPCTACGGKQGAVYTVCDSCSGARWVWLPETWGGPLFAQAERSFQHTIGKLIKRLRV